MIVAWPLLILVAIVGWGLAIVRLARRFSSELTVSAGEITSLGLAVVLTIAGVAVAADHFGVVFVFILLITGLALALWESIQWLWSRPKLGRRLALDAGVGGGLVLALFLNALSQTAHFHWNPCDDDPAYLYLARRLVVRGDLLDPLSNRRLTSPGGMSALQAIFLTRLPDTFLPFADLFLGSVLILFVLWRRRQHWASWGIIAAALVILFPDNLLSNGNSSPVLLPVGLALAALSFGFPMMLNPSHPSTPLRACGVGLLIGASAALRVQFAIPLGLSALVMIVWAAGRAIAMKRVGNVIVAAGTMAIGFLLSLAGWAVASGRAVGTPLFPLLPGNLDPTWPVNGPAVPIPLGEFLGRIGNALINPPWIAGLALGLLVLAIVLRAPARVPRLRFAALVLQGGATAAALLLMLFLAVIWWDQGDLHNTVRFWGPDLLAALLLPLVLLAIAELPTGPPLQISSLLIVGMVALTTLGAPAIGRVQMVIYDLLSAQVVPTLESDRYGSLRNDYTQASRLIAPGSTALTAVDVPSLLLAQNHDIHTLDIPGSTSPAPHMPLLQGTQPMLAWLHQHQYKQIVAVDPAQSLCLYNRVYKVQDLVGLHRQIYQAWAPYFFAWFDFLADVTRARANVVRVGSLEVITI